MLNKSFFGCWRLGNSFFKEVGDGVIIRICAKPGAKRFKIVLLDRCLEIFLESPPVRGKANRELINILSNIFGVSKKMIDIVSGEKSRDKLVKIAGISKEDLIERIKKFVT